MFKNNEADEAGKTAETIIGPSLKVKGNFKGKGSIIVEGEVVGTLKTDNHVFIGDKARVVANVDAQTSRIGGTVEGNISVSGHLEIVASARINGDIRCASISIEKGAFLNGKCTMGQAEKKEEKQKQDSNKN
jgi:cytoskeletal protein CcmA (bactofilin family)